MKKTFQMRISSINTLRFSQFDIEDINIDRKYIIEYESNFGIRLFEATDEIGMEATVKMKIPEIDRYFGELKIVIKFFISPFREVVVKNSETDFNIPDILLVNFTNIVAGAIRGILHEKLKGTILQDEVYPLIDVNQILKLKET